MKETGGRARVQVEVLIEVLLSQVVVGPFVVVETMENLAAIV
jgi:membrane glycosyltransferase